MRIETIAIDGFGQFHGAQLSPNPGLTVIRGPNEAGKTTLLAFTRAMLFGFATKKYPALNGGKRGGWLDVVMADGRTLRIERYGERGGDGTLRVIEDDKDLGPGHLGAILQGVEISVYQNIFAFGLGELTRFETLRDDEVAARIYGAGLGTGGVSGLKVEQALRERMEALFKPGGSRPELNALLKELEDVDRELQGRDLPQEYAAAGTRLEEVEELLTRLGTEYDELDAERRRQQRLQDSWETWLALRRAEDARTALGKVEAFESDALERLSVLEAAVAEAERGVDSAARDRDRAQARLDDAMLNEAVLARREDLAALGEATKIEAARGNERDRVARELDQARTAVENALDGLGAGWTAERVEDFDDSIAVKSEISGRWRTTLADAEQASAKANDSLAAAEERAREAREQAATAAARLAELDEALTDQPSSASRERAIREVERLTDELEAQHRITDTAPTDDLEATRTDLEDRRAKARDLAVALGTKQSTEEQLPAARAVAADASGRAQRQYLLPAAVGVGALVLAVVLALMEVPLAASIVVAAAGVGGAAAWIVVLRRQDGSSGTAVADRLEQQHAEAEATVGTLGPELGLGSSPSRSEVEAYLDDIGTALGSLERAEEQLERARVAGQELDRLSDELATAAEAVGLPRRPEADDLDAARTALAEIRAREAERAAAAEREEELEAATASQEKRVVELTAAAEKRREEAAAAQAAWETWLGDHGLESTYDRETAGRVVDAVSTAKTAVSALHKAQARATELEQEHADYADQVAALAGLLAEGEVTGDDLGATAALLAKALADALETERARAALATALGEKEDALVTATENRDTAEAELSTFLETAGSEDADALRREVARTREATALEAEVTAARQTLTTHSGPGKALEQLIDDLGAVEDIGDVKARLSDIAGQLGELDDRRDELNQEAGGLRAAREEMETDALATELRQRREDLLSRLRAGASRWSVLALAHRILSRSRSEYEAQHRPAVIDRAEHFFKAWTDGRYTRIVAPLGEDVRGIERLDGVEVPLVGLSRGTSEQLYLALRFGLVQHFVETSGEPLPIVMDDILVNFDPERAERAARSIEEIAETCQVIYFTCHETTPLHADLEQQLPRLEVSA